MDYKKTTEIKEEYITLLLNLREYIGKTLENLSDNEKDDNYYKLINCFQIFMENITIHHLFSSDNIKKYLSDTNKILNYDEREVYNCLDVIVYSCMIQESGSKIFNFDFKMIETILNMFVQMDISVEEYSKYLFILLDKDIESIILRYCTDHRFLVVLFEVLDEEIGSFNQSNQKVVSVIRSNITRSIRHYYQQQKYFEKEEPILEEPLTEKKIVSYLEKCLDVLEDDFLFGNFSYSFKETIEQFKKEFKYIPLSYQEEFYQGVRKILKDQNNLFDTVQQIIQFMDVLLWNFKGIDKKVVTGNFFNGGKKGK